jgi:hypothetical protein
MKTLKIHIFLQYFERLKREPFFKIGILPPPRAPESEKKIQEPSGYGNATL